MRVLVRNMSVLLIALAVLVAGLVGADRYWQDYYQTRGFTPVRLVQGARPTHEFWVHFYSPALHREAGYIVALPPGYSPRHRYPVYYLLHGCPGHPQAFTRIAGMPTRMSDLVSQHRIRPMILVFPDGRIGGSDFTDSEWANTPSGNYESYVIDVVHNVDHRFSTIARRSARAIAGLSAGAYGATNVALHHLNVFGNLQSWSGYYVETHDGVFANASPAKLAANSPLDYVSALRGQLRRYPLRAFLYAGQSDEASAEVSRMAIDLARAGASVSYALYPGGHDWKLWHAHLDRMLILASRDLAQPLGRGGGRARHLTPGVKPHPIKRHHPTLTLPRRRGGLRKALRLPVPRLQLVAWHAPAADRAERRELPLSTLLGGLILALLSAALINLGFLLQARGLTRRPSGSLLAALRLAMRERTWLVGQAVGWLGFGAQMVAVAVAPLALVQAFAAGGLALSVPLAARWFHFRISRGQRQTVLLMAAALAVLPLGYGPSHDHFYGSQLLAILGAVALLAALVAAVSAAAARAIAAGAFYGLADAAIKAVSVSLGHHGLEAIVSPWTLVAAGGTFAGFLAFQTALRDGSAVGAISLMNGFAALVAVGVGLSVFGERLGTTPVATVSHLAGIAIVLACVPALAAAQVEMAEPDTRSRELTHPPRGPAEYQPAR